MKITKFKSLALFPLLAMALAGCNPSSGGGSTPATEKQDPVINIALEDGKQFNVGSFVEPQITTVPADLSKTITYYSGNSAVGSTAPQQVGDYKITVTTAENSNYKAGSASKNFLIRNVPTLSFYYGSDVPMVSGQTFNVGSVPEIYAKSSVEGATITYSYTTSTGEALPAKPTTAGVYFIIASVARTATIGSTSASISFELVNGSTETPVVKFFYNGEEKCLESNWLDGGFATSQYDAANFDITKLTYTVTPAGISYTEQWAFKALDAPEEVDGSPINKPSNPLNPGIYTITVTPNGVARGTWAGFVIKDNGGGTPTGQTTVKFFYDGVEKCLESNWLDGGFATSQYDAASFDVTKLTYTVTPAGTSSTEQWAFKALDAPEDVDGSPINKPSNPLNPGIYTITVTPAGATRGTWAGFVIKDNGGGGTPTGQTTVKFFYDGVEKCLESNWLDGGFAASHYDASAFDIAKFSFTVTPAGTQYTESWTLKALDAPEEADGSPIAKPTANPLAPGIYACTVTPTGATKGVWAGFVINDNGQTPQPQQNPVIKFYYDGTEKALDGANWLEGGYATSQYDASAFDITKFSIGVTPDGTAYTESWALKALDAPEDVDGSPIAKPTANPLAPGIYTVRVEITGTSQFRWAGFVIKASAQQDPVINFYYDGVKKCLESNWLDGGYADSLYDASAFDIAKLTVEVTPAGTQYTESWTLNEAPIAKPTANPLAAGTYAVTITAGSVTKWAGFRIKASAPTKTDPVIKFFYNSEEVGVSGTRWFYEGYGDSQFNASDFDIAKFSVQVSDGADYSVTWTLNDAPITAPTANPLAAGTYAVTVTVTENVSFNAGSQYILFAIKASAPAKTDASIRFFYNNEEVGISGTRWFYEGYGDSQFNASDFDLSKFSIQVSEGAEYSVAWTLNEVAITAPTANPLAAGTYAVTVTVTENASFNAGSQYILFHIK